MSKPRTLKMSLIWRVIDFLACAYASNIPSEEEPYHAFQSSATRCHGKPTQNKKVRFVDQESDDSSWHNNGFEAGDNIDQANPSSSPTSRKGKGKVNIHVNEDRNPGKKRKRRVRDYLSCVYGCNFPLEEEEEEEEEEPHALESSSHQLSHGSTIFHPQVYSRSYRTREIITNSTQSNNNSFVEETDDSSWHNNRLGAGDNFDQANPSSRPISRKGKGKENVPLNEEWNRGEIRGVNEVRKNRKCKGVSVESIDSNQSDSSASSFAFPIMNWESMGSPVRMPKPEEGLQLRKHIMPWSEQLHYPIF